jgi:lysophospholipase L1-like esterase
MTQILVFGDSIAFGAWDEKGGWVERLREFLTERTADNPNSHYFIQNFSLSGDTSEWLLERFGSEGQNRLETEREKNEEIMLIFAIGMNDTKFIHSRSATLTSTDQYKTNIEKLIKLAKKHVVASKILFVGLTPVDEESLERFTKPLGHSFKNDFIEDFEKTLKGVCEAAGVHFIDVFHKLNGDGYEKLLQDGLHPNSDGHQRIFEIVRDFLTEKRVI